MLINQRVIYKDNSVLTDVSHELNDLFNHTVSFSFVSAEDYFFIGSDLPFNHRYIQVVSANNQAATPSIAIWDGSTWNSAVDVIDATKDGQSYPLTASGILRWSTDRNKSWAQEETTENISALSTLKIYNMYWMRLGFSANLKNNASISYIGYKFGNDSTLAALYPDLARSAVMTAHTSGKTNWNEQQVLASEMVVNDLRKERILSSRSQIFEPETFEIAGVHKTAEIIYAAFGESKKEERLLARELYKEAMSGIIVNNIDKDGDGHLSEDEKFGTITWARV